MVCLIIILSLMFQHIHHASIKLIMMIIYIVVIHNRPRKKNWRRVMMTRGWAANDNQQQQLFKEKNSCGINNSTYLYSHHMHTRLHLVCSSMRIKLIHEDSQSNFNNRVELDIHILLFTSILRLMIVYMGICYL